ncbi:MAG: hypothetical protein ABSC23_14655 [Bryobacteraceae bacterium]|jgi:hypothetical protein
MQSKPLRLAHGWTLNGEAGISRTLARDFIRPAVRAVPSSMARRLGLCRVSVPGETKADETSRWTVTKSALEVSVAAAGIEEHDVGMELLLCLGQALWEKLSGAELRAYWKLLSDEISVGVEGEIDEQALEEKRSLLGDRSHGNSAAWLTRYGRASLAGTAAEYVHCLWHEVTVRTGPVYLPAPALRRRLELMARWFPPDRGYRLFPAARLRTGPSPSSRAC